jgi:hypothetical protein
MSERYNILTLDSLKVRQYNHTWDWEVEDAWGVRIIKMVFQQIVFESVHHV